MKKILVSACLYGEICRYDGKKCGVSNEIFDNLKKSGKLVPVCPELLGGLEIPRVPCEISDGRVINKNGEDKTENFISGALRTLQIAKEKDVCCCIMKSRSPSCGSGMIYDGSFSGRKTEGYGITSALLIEKGYPVFDEEHIADALNYAENVT